MYPLNSGMGLVRSSAEPVHTAMPEPKPARRFKLSTLVLILLVLAAVGQLYNNIALFRFGGYAITPPLVLLGLAAALSVFIPRRAPANDTPFIIGIILIGWTIVSAVLLGIAGNGEWQKSAQLLVMYASCFALASRLQIDNDDLAYATPVLIGTIVIGGILGVGQFILLNYTNVAAVVPEGLRVSRWDPTGDIFRTGGFQRAAGLSYEPSTYAVALSIAAVLCLFFCGLYARVNRFFLVIALVLLVAGSLVSYSVSGWVVGLFPVMLGILAVRSQVRGTLLVLMLVAALVLPALYSFDMLPGISERVESITSGEEDSANVRVVGALTLLFAPPERFTDFVAGYGIGMEETYAPIVTEIYGRRFGVYEINIHNIFTVVKVTQGWLGIALHLTLILAVFRPAGIKDPALYAPLLLLVLLIHFASGYYLDPIFWSLLTLIAVLRNANFQTHPAQTADELVSPAVAGYSSTPGNLNAPSFTTSGSGVSHGS